MKKVAIIGGGIAGLAAAYALEEKGENIEYTLIEKDARLGGKILTETHDGFLVEGGPDCFLSEKPSVIKLAEKIGLADSLIGTNDEFKGTYVYSGGRVHALPEGLMLMVPTKIVPFALSPLISWPGKMRMALDFVLPRKKDDDDETLHNFVVRRLGREALDKIAEPLIGGIHGGNPETMSLKASFPRFLDMERNYGSLIRAMLAARRRSPAKRPEGSGGKPGTYFMSFKNGMGELTDALEKKLGGRILKGKEVVKVGRSGTHYQILGDGFGEITADAVIFALPAPEAAALIRGWDAASADILEETPMASSATVSLAFRREQLPFSPASFGFLIPHVEQRKINAVTFSSIKWNYRMPDEDSVLLRTFVGGAKNSHLACAGEEEILHWVKQDLKSILGISSNPVMSRIHRWIHARPQYTMGHLERLHRVEQRLKSLPGFYLAGGCYRGIGVPDCINDGMNAAENVMRFLHGTRE
ncbi:protoporphyrinogen oxidase [Candidatus Formimonas warabiya]|uniref:Coproporphyrinogen III oxidase n=1 Tax=Formimonas warabiya TaxID=1761012 RepID=A0A3G1KTC1_FORW1|nr:protoporphyrinogen oxidase [Candidatus Formimonas warabiya]ATW25699.1 protoporphyrinogen oxidase [Candidatus Formimonas warabiya]